MILSDGDISRECGWGRIQINPWSASQLQPSSYDVLLDNKFLIFNSHNHDVIDPKEDQSLTDELFVQDGQFVTLHPQQFMLAATREYIGLPDNLVARVEGKSSLGRLGLMVHVTAGFVDPGWQGPLTFELANVSPLPIRLYPGMPIAQISFIRMTSPADNPYSGKYQGATGPQPSRYFRNFQKSDSLTVADELTREAQSLGLYGARLTCGCWDEAPPGRKVGDFVHCHDHGDQHYIEMNVAQS